MKRLPLLALLFLLFCLPSCLSYIEKNKKTGNLIIERIEKYKKDSGHLPDQINYIGSKYEFLDFQNDSTVVSVLEIDGEVFCYQRLDSINYTIWFGTSLGEGIYYYSDSKQWEDRLRKAEGQAKVFEITIEYQDDTESESLPIKCGNLTGDVFYDEISVPYDHHTNGIYHYQLEQDLPDYISIPIDLDGSYIKVILGNYKCTELNIKIKSPLVENYLTDTIIEQESTFQIKTDKRTHQDTLYFENSKIQTQIVEGISHNDGFQFQINEYAYIGRLDAYNNTDIESAHKYKNDVFRRWFGKRKYIYTVHSKTQWVYYLEIYL